MNFNFVVTTIGLRELRLLTAPPVLNATKGFAFGDATHYTPVVGDTDIHGADVDHAAASGILLGRHIVTSHVTRYMAIRPNSVGPVTYREMALYGLTTQLPVTEDNPDPDPPAPYLLGLASFASPYVVKTKSTGNDHTGKVVRVDCFLTRIGDDYETMGSHAMCGTPLSSYIYEEGYARKPIQGTIPVYEGRLLTTAPHLQ